MNKKRQQNRAPLTFPDRTPARILPIRDGVVAIPQGSLLQFALLLHDIKKSQHERGVSYAKAA